MYKHNDRFPWANYLKIVYNDALTFDPKTKTGGLKNNFKFSSFIRAAQNKHLQLLINELTYKKLYEEDIVLDKFSMADYYQTAALLVIRESEGPNLLDQITYGRKDVQSESEIGSVQNIPTASNYRESLRARGFEDDEIVALASIETYGIIRDPKKLDASKFPKLDNYVFKQFLLNSNDKLEFQQTLIGTPELKEQVEKFAQDEKEFHKSFSTAFVKLLNLGHDSDELIHVENLLEDHPYKKFIGVYY